MKRAFYIIGGLTLAISIPSALQAQTTQPKDTTMNRTVVVEQEYNPDIMDASKVNVLPKVEEPTVSKKNVEYATTFFPATSVPAGLMRPYTGKETQPGSTPGYVRAGYGNYGNLDVLANYLFRLSDKDKLNVRFQMDGMDGKLTIPFTDSEKWNAFYYRTRANVVILTSNREVRTASKSLHPEIFMPAFISSMKPLPCVSMPRRIC